MSWVKYVNYPGLNGGGIELEDNKYYVNF